MPEPTKIPVADRYGACEDPKCVGRVYNRLCDRKPVWLLDGRRLCNDCLRRTQRAVTS
jgi:hypothetical protein